MRPLVLIPAMLATATIVSALHAAEPVPAYRATLATPLAAPADLTVMGSVAFRCEGDRCAAPRSSTARSQDVCADLARHTGGVAAFEVRGRPLSEKMVARCNGRAGV